MSSMETDSNLPPEELLKRREHELLRASIYGTQLYLENECLKRELEEYKDRLDINYNDLSVKNIAEMNMDKLPNSPTNRNSNASPSRHSVGRLSRVSSSTAINQDANYWRDILDATEEELNLKLQQAELRSQNLLVTNTKLSDQLSQSQRQITYLNDQLVSKFLAEDPHALSLEDIETLFFVLQNSIKDLLSHRVPLEDLNAHEAVVTPGRVQRVGGNIVLETEGGLRGEMEEIGCYRFGSSSKHCLEELSKFFLKGISVLGKYSQMVTDLHVKILQELKGERSKSEALQTRIDEIMASNRHNNQTVEDSELFSIRQKLTSTQFLLEEANQLLHAERQIRQNMENSLQTLQPEILTGNAAVLSLHTYSSPNEPLSQPRSKSVFGLELERLPLGGTPRGALKSARAEGKNSAVLPTAKPKAKVRVVSVEAAASSTSSEETDEDEADDSTTEDSSSLDIKSVTAQAKAKSSPLRNSALLKTQLTSNVAARSVNPQGKASMQPKAKTKRIPNAKVKPPSSSEGETDEDDAEDDDESSSSSSSSESATGIKANVKPQNNKKTSTAISAKDKTVNNPTNQKLVTPILSKPKVQTASSSEEKTESEEMGEDEDREQVDVKDGSVFQRAADVILDSSPVSQWSKDMIEDQTSLKNQGLNVNHEAVERSATLDVGKLQTSPKNAVYLYQNTKIHESCHSDDRLEIEEMEKTIEQHVNSKIENSFVHKEKLSALHPESLENGILVDFIDSSSKIVHDEVISQCATCESLKKELEDCKFQVEILLSTAKDITTMTSKLSKVEADLAKCALEKRSFLSELAKLQNSNSILIPSSPSTPRVASSVPLSPSSENSGLKAKIALLNSQISSLQEEKARLQIDLSAAEFRVSEVESENLWYEGKIRRMRGRIQELEEWLAEMEELEHKQEES